MNMKSAHGKATGFAAEFKKFIARGNVIDLAVGVIIGGAFSAITASLTSDVIMPVVSIFLGGVDFSAMKLVLAILVFMSFSSSIMAVYWLNHGG